MRQALRLPFHPSSDLSLGILRGNDETVGLEDIFNDTSHSELMGELHLTVEYKLSLLGFSVLFMKIEGMHLVYICFLL